MHGMAAKKIQFLRDASTVKRFHTERTIELDTIGHHSANVALICWVLTDGKASKNLLLKALLHDLEEKYTGDTPAPFKRVLRKMGVLEENLGREFLEENGISEPLLKDEESIILKIADILDLCYKCKDELEMGNTKVHNILVNGMSYLGDIAWPESIKQNLEECLKDLAGLIHVKSVEPIIVPLSNTGI